MKTTRTANKKKLSIHRQDRIPPSHNSQQQQQQQHDQLIFLKSKILKANPEKIFCGPE